MGDKPPRVLQGCRKVRFDEPGWKGKPRYRFVYRNEPSDGAPAKSVVLAIGRRDRMMAYAQATRPRAGAGVRGRPIELAERPVCASARTRHPVSFEDSCPVAPVGALAAARLGSGEPPGLARANSHSDQEKE